jgi:phosphoribosylaminoimidazole carboxylase PurK protein
MSAPRHLSPSPQDIRIIQDKYAQKEFLQKNGIAVAPFTKINTFESAISALNEYGGKMLLKTRFGAYDGRGNKVVSSEAELPAAIEAFGNAELYAERFIPFVKELAVMVGRDMQGSISTYPVVETIHQRNICVEVLAPAQVSEAIAAQATAIVRSVAELMHGAGVFGVELFLTPDGQILLNEIAPRVHNSGHYTIEACRTSQFEQHVRAISGLPLGDTTMVVPTAVMVNILGERNAAVDLTGVSAVLTHPATSLHMYGKSPTKIDRKMGHITTTGTDPRAVKGHAEQARKELTV